MTDFSKDTGEAFDRAITRSYRIGWASCTIFFAVVYFAAHIGLWLHRGHPVIKDVYRSSHSNRYLVDREAVRIRTK